jgi:hypothetical protein
MIDISGFGTGVTIIALSSFPMGLTVSQFADDQDAVTCEEIETSAWEMLYDGSLFSYDKAAPVIINLSVIAGSSDDTNLKILLQARKGASKIIPLPDVTSMVINSPTSGVVMLSNGTIFKGPLVDTVQSSGRKKGNTYSFAFGSFQGAQSALELVAGIAQAAIGFLE